MNILLIIVLCVGFYVSWNIGANDAANSMGVAVGSNVINFKKAVLVLSFFVLLGVSLEGGAVMQTTGGGIINSSVGNPLSHFPILTVVILLVAGLWVSVATKFGLPVSTTQSMIGSVAGAGLSLMIINIGITTSINTYLLLGIMFSWAIAPVASIFFAYFFYDLFAFLINKVKGVYTVDKILSFLIIIGGAGVAYTLGTNDVSTVMGVASSTLGGSLAEHSLIIGLFGGLALIIGVISYSRKVMNAVGSEITKLNPQSAFVAQISAVIIVWSFNQFGIPVSTTQAIVGGVCGVGLSRSVSTVNREKIKSITLAWVLTPLLSAVLTFIVSFIIFNIWII